jgi:hypothetical protein
VPKKASLLVEDMAMPCFSFYKDYETLKVTDLEFKESFSYKMIHPYEQHVNPVATSEILRYDMTLSKCTLYKGVPYGLAHISFKHPTLDWLSFEGMGVFTDGKLHMGPFTCQCGGKGYRRSYSLMIDGRPADSSFYTQFSYNRLKLIVESLKTSIDVSGYQYRSSRVQQAVPHGEGKEWLSNGRIFIGDFKETRMHSGKIYEMQQDDTYTLYNVQYDAIKDADNEIWADN